jgi:plasmid stabilization system protein ParE
MKKHKLILTEEAVRDIEVSFQYYQEKQSGLGERFLAHIEEVIHLISQNPEICPTSFKTVRQATVNRFPFVVLYEIEEKHIVVYSVFHTSQHPIKKVKRIRRS